MVETRAYFNRRVREAVIHGIREAPQQDSAKITVYDRPHLRSQHKELERAP